MWVIRPQDMWSYGKSVAAAATAANYSAASATDRAPNKPYKSTSGAATLTITGSAGPVDLLALGHTNLRAPATATYDINSGAVTGSFTIDAARANNIPWNPWVRLDSPVASVTSIVITIASNPGDVIVGEVFAGQSTAFDLLFNDHSLSIEDVSYPNDGEEDASSVVVGYTPDLVSMPLGGSAYLTSAELQWLLSWREGTRGGAVPSIIVPLDSWNHAWAVRFDGPISWTQAGADCWNASMAWREFSRVLWSE